MMETLDILDQMRASGCAPNYIEGGGGWLPAKNAREGCHVSNVNALFVYPLNLLTTRVYVCHDKNIRGMVGPKKTLRSKLDIQPNIWGICSPFPLT